MTVRSKLTLGATLVALTSPAAAYDVATMHPGCLQQHAWCERAASVSYGDQSRFRNALSAVIAVEWMRMVEAARKVATAEGYPVRAPSVEEITADLIQAWRIGSSCCDVALKPPLEVNTKSSVPVDYDALCRSGADGSAESAANVERCVAAVRTAAPKP
jgi:hypothetical protein